MPYLLENRLADSCAAAAAECASMGGQAINCEVQEGGFALYDCWDADPQWTTPVPTAPGTLPTDPYVGPGMPSTPQPGGQLPGSPGTQVQAKPKASMAKWVIGGGAVLGVGYLLWKAL